MASTSQDAGGGYSNNDSNARRIDADLQKIMDRWDDLQPAIQAAIMALVNAAG